jgi:uncharacterized membrane protein YphA (DoxX/SURF4 family)
MKVIVHFCRYATGLLFIFSGLIKLNDPAGTQIKMDEYFEVFAHDFSPLFEHFVPLALPIAIIMCVLEVVLGVALLFLYRMKATTWALLGIIVFFSFLTFYSAYFNKVTDCGCFGDAIKLTPWQSFGKDVVLTLLILVLFLNKNNLKTTFSEKLGAAVVGGATILSCFAAYWAIAHLPFIDFRPYKIGDSIPENMKMPPNARPDRFAVRMYTLTNAVTKEVKTMPDTTYMNSGIWEDTTWAVTATTDPVLLEKGDRPKITDYSLTDSDGQDITNFTFEGNKLIIVVRQVEDANKDCFPAINTLVKELELSPLKVIPLAITSSDGAKFEEFRHSVQLAIPYYFTDNTVLKTIMRSNPGVWLLKDGVVKGKWHYNDVPTAKQVTGLLQ